MNGLGLLHRAASSRQSPGHGGTVRPLRGAAGPGQLRATRFPPASERSATQPGKKVGKKGQRRGGSAALGCGAGSRRRGTAAPAHRRAQAPPPRLQPRPRGVPGRALAAAVRAGRGREGKGPGRAGERQGPPRHSPAAPQHPQRPPHTAPPRRPAAPQPPPGGSGGCGVETKPGINGLKYSGGRRAAASAATHPQAAGAEREGVRPLPRGAGEAGPAPPAPAPRWLHPAEGAAPRRGTGRAGLKIIIN